MPRPKRVPGGRERARSADPLTKVRALAFDIEEPLNDAIDYLHALRLIGDGMAADHDADGRAILIIAWAVLQRLETLKDKWRAIGKAVRRRGSSKRGLRTD